MLTEERYDYIKQELNRFGTVQTQELILALDVSESTIRRDLSELESLGALVRVHGGAKLPYVIEKEFSMAEKSAKNLQEKLTIGKLAASLVQDNETLFIDAGTSTLTMIPFLKGKAIQVVTNSMQNAFALLEIGIPTILIGGQVKASTQAIIGPSAMEQIASYQFSRCFLGMNGFSSQYGFTTPDENEAAIKNLAIKQSRFRYVLADVTKANLVSFCKVAPLEEATLITNTVTDELRETLSQYTTIMEASQ